MINSSQISEKLSMLALNILHAFESVFAFSASSDVVTVHDELKELAKNNKMKVKDILATIWGLQTDSDEFARKRNVWDATVSRQRRAMQGPKDEKADDGTPKPLTKAELVQKVADLEKQVAELKIHNADLIKQIVMINETVSNHVVQTKKGNVVSIPLYM